MITHNLNWITYFKIFIFIVLGLLIGNAPSHAQSIPVILDTDMGADIDDTWALSFILASKELDLQMVVTESNDTTSKAKLVAKYLERVKRDNVSIGIGIKKDDKTGPQEEWANDYNLEDYWGEVYDDGVQGMIDLIMSRKGKTTIIVIGPCHNIGEMLKREPKITEKVQIVAMSGSIRYGYGGIPSPEAEYNVRNALDAAQTMYNADWDLSIAPLDATAIFELRGEKYLSLFYDPNLLIDTLITNYRYWVEKAKRRIDPNVRSTILYDIVAAYMAYDDSYLQMEEMKLKVDHRGYTVKDPRGKTVRVARGWKDLSAFEDMVVERLKRGIAYPFHKPQRVY